MTKEETSWKSRYQPASRLIWRGRVDASHPTRFHEIAHFTDLRNAVPQATNSQNFALIGFACDEGIQRNYGRSGAVNGAEACKQALANTPTHSVSPDTVLHDFGQVDCRDGNLEASQEALGNVVDLTLSQGFHPIVIGGGHETAWGHFQGLLPHLENKRLAIVNFDAHFDIRPLLNSKAGSSGTPFLQIADSLAQHNRPFHYHVIGLQRFSNPSLLFEKAKELSVHYTFAEEICSKGTAAYLEYMNQIIAEHDALYLSIDLDVFAAAYAPGVSAPQPLGLNPWQLIPLIKLLAESGKVIGMDICELSPPHDRDGTTAQLAASLITRYLHYSTQHGLSSL